MGSVDKKLAHDSFKMEEKLGDKVLKGEPIGEDEERHLVNEEKKKSSHEESHQRSAIRRCIGLVLVVVVALALTIYFSPVTGWTEDETDIDQPNIASQQDGKMIRTRPPFAKNASPPHNGNSNDQEDDENNAFMDGDDFSTLEKEEEEAHEDSYSEEMAEEAKKMKLLNPDAEEELVNPEDITVPDEPSDSEVQQLKALLNGQSHEDDDEDEEEKTKMSQGSAPRTSTVPYNHMEADGKYLIYNPSGGMSNQEIELVNALRMAKTIGRTLYVPMVGRHSNLPIGYANLGYKDLFPADRIWDFQLLEKFVPVIPLNMTFRRFLAKAAHFKGGTHHVRYIPTEYGYNGRLNAIALRKITSTLILLSGKGMWSRWWSHTARQDTRRYVAYNPPLRRLAVKVAHAHLGPKFYSIHGRLGDEKYKWDGKDSGDIFVRTRRFRAWDKSLKVYLASDDPNNAFFRPLKQEIKVVTSVNLKGPDVDEYRQLFPTDRVRHDMFGVLEKLICAMGIEFLGSSFSTFSLEIKMIRSQARFVFPELYAIRHNLTTTPEFRP